MEVPEAKWPSPSARHVSTLDGIRGLAILGVLAVHLDLIAVIPNHSPFTSALTKILWCGWSGVDLFFVLSGFLITGILLDSKSSPHYFKAFYARRALRIFPLYYFAVFASILFVPLAARKLHWLSALYPTPLGWLSFLLYYQNWWITLREPTHGFLGQFWSLGVEEQFYLLWPTVVYLVSFRRLNWACLAGSVLALVSRCWIARPGPASEIILTSTLTRLDSLLIGGFVAISVRDAGLLRHVKRLSPYVFALALAVIVCIDEIGHETLSRAYWTQTVGFTFYALGYACLILWAFLGNRTGTWFDRALRFPPLRSFGKYSYGIYVYHSVVFLTCERLLKGFGWYGRSLVPSLLAAATIVALSWGIAALSFRFFESRFLAMKRFFRADGQTASPPSVQPVGPLGSL